MVLLGIWNVINVKAKWEKGYRLGFYMWRPVDTAGNILTKFFMSKTGMAKGASFIYTFIPINVLNVDN
jgi:hypothetical protein